MHVAFARYSRDRSFVVIRERSSFVLTMAAGSVVGTLMRGALVAVVSTQVLVPLLVVLRLMSSAKVWRHGQ